jgi:CCR4-NOT transcription complex subunit 6
MSFDKEKESVLNGYPPLQGHPSLQQQQFYSNSNTCLQQQQNSQNSTTASSPSIGNFHMPLYSTANNFNRYPLQQQKQATTTTSPRLSSSTSIMLPDNTNNTGNSIHVTRQLTYAQNSRQSSSPHHHARTAAAMARSTPVSSTVTITDPNNPNSNKIFNRIDTVTMSSVDEQEGQEGGQTWTTLDIGGMGLKQISPTLCSYTFLTILYMNHNNLTHLTSDISKLVNLKTLDCSGNKLSTLPPELGLLINLRDLLLFDNNLTNLPSELGMLYQLEMLGLEGNPIQSDIKNILMKEGTQAVIISLRENAPG